MKPNRIQRAPSHRSSEVARYALIAIVCLLSLVAIRAYAAEAAPAKRPAPTVEGAVATDLLPGATTTVAFTVQNPSSRSMHVGAIVLSKIEVDADHSSCVAALDGAGAAFVMPPVEVDRSFPPGRTALAATGRLTMIDTGAAEDACSGATLTLTLATR